MSSQKVAPPVGERGQRERVPPFRECTRGWRMASPWVAACAALRYSRSGIRVIYQRTGAGHSSSGPPLEGSRAAGVESGISGLVGGVSRLPAGIALSRCLILHQLRQESSAQSVPVGQSLQPNLRSGKWNRWILSLGQRFRRIVRQELSSMRNQRRNRVIQVRHRLTLKLYRLLVARGVRARNRRLPKSGGEQSLTPPPSARGEVFTLHFARSEKCKMKSTK